jgi:hypothetical protein
VAIGCTAQIQTRTVELRDGRSRTEEHVDGVPHGAYIIYNPRGAVTMQGQYKRGKQHGVFRFFDESGGLSRRVAYDEGRIVWESSDPRDPLPSTVSPLDQAVAPPEPWDPRPAHQAFPTLHLLAPRTRATAIGSFHPPGEGWGQRLSLLASYRKSHAIGYAALHHSLYQFDGGFAQGRVLGEGGGGVVLEVAGHDAILHVGAFGPLATERISSFASDATSIPSRLGDLALALPRTAGFRTGASLLGEMERFNYRLDLGFDAAFSHAGMEETPRLDDSIALHGRVAAGVGYETRYMMLSGELVTVAQERTASASGERLLHALAINLHVKTNIQLQPSLGLVLPLMSGEKDAGLAFLTSLLFDYD